MHNIEKTKVLLLRDLPFITRLSKYYDLALINPLPNKSSHPIDNKPKPIPNLLGKDQKDGHQNFENQFDNPDINEALEILKGNKPDTNNKSKTANSKNIDDPVIEEMQRQSQV
jgi:hypothetical protein